jgi:glutamyl-tRNA reductase
VAELSDVFLYSVDDLADIVQDGVANRQSAVMQAEAIIASGVAEFLRWLEIRGAVPAIRALRDSVERARRHELERALKKLAGGENPQLVLDSLSRSLANKLLHVPTEALTQADAATRAQMLASLERLYRTGRSQREP